MNNVFFLKNNVQTELMWNQDFRNKKCRILAFRDKTVLNTFNAWISLSLGKGGLEKNL